MNSHFDRFDDLNVDEMLTQHSLFLRAFIRCALKLDDLNIDNFMLICQICQFNLSTV